MVITTRSAPKCGDTRGVATIRALPGEKCLTLRAASNRVTTADLVWTKSPRKGQELRAYRFGRRHLADCFLSVEMADCFNAEPDPLGVRQADFEIGWVAPGVFDRPLADQFGLTFVADFGVKVKTLATGARQGRPALEPEDFRHHELFDDRRVRDSAPGCLVRPRDRGRDGPGIDDWLGVEFCLGIESKPGEPQASPALGGVGDRSRMLAAAEHHRGADGHGGQGSCEVEVELGADATSSFHPSKDDESGGEQTPYFPELGAPGSGCEIPEAALPCVSG